MGPTDHFGYEAQPVDLGDVSVRALVAKGASSWAVIEVSPTITVLLQEQPWAFFSGHDLACLPSDLHPGRFDVVAMKIGINIEDVAKDIGACGSVLASTPGPTQEPLPARGQL